MSLDDHEDAPHGVCMYCGTPRTTNQEGLAQVGRDALICPNSACPSMQLLLE